MTYCEWIQQRWLILRVLRWAGECEGTWQSSWGVFQKVDSWHSFKVGAQWVGPKQQGWRGGGCVLRQAQHCGPHAGEVQSGAKPGVRFGCGCDCVWGTQNKRLQARKWRPMVRQTQTHFSSRCLKFFEQFSQEWFAILSNFHTTSWDWCIGFVVNADVLDLEVFKVWTSLFSRLLHPQKPERVIKVGPCKLNVEPLLEVLTIKRCTSFFWILVVQLWCVPHALPNLGHPESDL